MPLQKGINISCQYFMIAVFIKLKKCSQHLTHSVFKSCDVFTVDVIGNIYCSTLCRKLFPTSKNALSKNQNDLASKYLVVETLLEKSSHWAALVSTSLLDRNFSLRFTFLPSLGKPQACDLCK